MADETTKTLLSNLGLSILSTKFAEERVDLQVISSAGDQDLIRLGVVTIGDRVRLRDACRRILRSSASGGGDPISSSTATTTNNQGPSSRHSNIEERRQLFTPRSSSGFYVFLYYYFFFQIYFL